MTQAPKGTHDIYGAQMRIWRRVEDEIRTLTDVYGYGEIRTPMFESTALFLRGVGDTTDIVQKEMYIFEDKGGRSITLRPEMTAGVVRAYIERGLHNAPGPTRVFYIGPCFRYEKPQSGRYRQHYQFGLEVFGAEGPAAEAEIISLGHRLITRLGIDDVKAHINSIGCATCRVAYNDTLRGFLTERLSQLCGLCTDRNEKNPLRVLDCKNANCQAQILEAPTTTTCLCADCEAHFNTLQQLLQSMGIDFVVDPKVVRGLDYYTRTVFEFIKEDSGQTVIGGGRYDGLIAHLGGANTPAVGFGMGLERLVSMIVEEETPATVEIFVGSADTAGFEKSVEVVNQLRRRGIRAENELAGRSVKAQMKYANKIGAKYTTILGESEVSNNTCTLKNMKNSNTVTIKIEELREELK